MPGWSETAAPAVKPVERGRKVTQDDYRTQTKAKNRGEFFKISDVKSIKRDIVKSSVFEGYAAGSIVSVIGGPKAGKSTFSLQEVIQASREGYDCLYLFNESPKVRFADIVRRRMEQMRVGELDLTGVTFCNAHGETLGSANYANIESYMTRFWAGKIDYWLSYAKKPKFVVVDSISKVGRVFTAQMFKMMESLCGAVVNSMDDRKKYPVVLLIHQKSGGFNERHDDSVVGGAGLIHESDATMNIRKYEVDRKMARDTGFAWGSRFYTLQVDTRDVDCPSEERMLTFKDGYLRVSKTIEQYAADSMEDRDSQRSVDTEKNEKKSGWS